jgi:hypothetical protein
MAFLKVRRSRAWDTARAVTILTPILLAVAKVFTFKTAIQQPGP